MVTFFPPKEKTEANRPTGAKTILWLAKGAIGGGGDVQGDDVPSFCTEWKTVNRIKFARYLDYSSEVTVLLVSWVNKKTGGENSSDHSWNMPIIVCDDDEFNNNDNNDNRLDF